MILQLSIVTYILVSLGAAAVTISEYATNSSHILDPTVTTPPEPILISLHERQNPEAPTQTYIESVTSVTTISGLVYTETNYIVSPTLFPVLQRIANIAKTKNGISAEVLAYDADVNLRAEDIIITGGLLYIIINSGILGYGAELGGTAPITMINPNPEPQYESGTPTEDEPEPTPTATAVPLTGDIPNPYITDILAAFASMATMTIPTLDSYAAVGNKQCAPKGDAPLDRDASMASAQQFCKINKDITLTNTGIDVTSYPQNGGVYASFSISRDSSCSNLQPYRIDELQCMEYFTGLIDGCFMGDGNPKFGGTFTTPYCTIYNLAVLERETVTCNWNPHSDTATTVSSNQAIDAINKYCAMDYWLDPKVSPDPNAFYQFGLPYGLSQDSEREGGSTAVSMGAQYINNAASVCSVRGKLHTQGPECVRILTKVVNQCGSNSQGGYLDEYNTYGCVTWFIYFTNN